MANGLPQLQPFQPGIPNLAQAFQQRNVNQQNQQLANLQMQALQQDVAQQQQAQAQQQSNVLDERKRQKIDRSLQLLSRVTDDNSLNVARQILATEFPEGVQDDQAFFGRMFPGGFDPATSPVVLQQLLGNLEKTKQAADFTLSPGQQRFTGKGELVAEVAPTEKEKKPLSKMGKEAFDREQGFLPEIDPKLKNKLQGKDLLDREEKLRKEFTKISDTFRKQSNSFDRVIASADEPSAAGDLALIFNFMKVLDPGSVVRESEFANAAATGAYGERLKGAALKIIRGVRLSDTVRQDFVTRATKLFDKAKNKNKQNTRTFTRLAEKAGVNPENVAIPLGTIPEGEDAAEIGTAQPFEDSTDNPKNIIEVLNPTTGELETWDLISEQRIK